MQDAYQVLGLAVRPGSSQPWSSEEIKTAYRKALLKYHPDKAVDKIRSEEARSVDEISQAYEVLSDSSLRAAHDRALTLCTMKQLRAQDSGLPGLEVVDLDDLLCDEATHTWSRACRCGQEQGFVITEAQLERTSEHGEVLTGCQGCSLWLKVVFQAVDGG